MGSLKRQVGLDIGSASVKVAIFEGKGRKAQFVGVKEYDPAAEGILNETELYRGLRDWLHVQQLDKAQICVGLPQYISTIQVVDLPPAKDQQIEAMVDAETQQIGGFSDEAFLHGYIKLPPGNGHGNPVLIGLCREQAIREKITVLEQVDIPLEDIVMSGMSVVNAFMNLVPGQAQSSSPVLLLDLGKENSTAIVVAGGQPLFMGSMMFSGDKFETAVRERAMSRKSLGGVQSVAELMKDVDLTTETAHSELRQIAKQLDSEIQNVVEHWRSQEREEMAEKPIQQVYLCGGASRVGGLLAWLEEAFECKMNLLGPKIDGVVRPEFTVAYGLGLECAQASVLPLSLLPKEQRELRHRLARWPYLAGAAGLFLASLLGLAVSIWLWSGGMMRQMEEYEERLNGCEMLIRQIEEIIDKTQDLETRLAPVVESANRSRRALQTLELLEANCEQRIWMTYLADAKSYAEWGTVEGKDNSIPRRSGGRHREKQEKTKAGIFDGGAVEMSLQRGGDDEFPVKLRAQDTSSESAFVCAGYTPMKDKKSFSESTRQIAELANRLSDKKLFSQVDTLENITLGERLELAEPWIVFLKKFPDCYFNSFVLRLPYAESEMKANVLQSGKGK